MKPLLLFGKSTSFQNSSWELQTDLWKLLNYQSNELVKCFPLPILSERPFRGRSYKFKRIWLKTAFLIRLLRGCRIDASADALMFRNDNSMSGIGHLLKIIEQSARVLLIAPDPEFLDVVRRTVSKDINDQHIEMIIVPKNNAYLMKRQLIERLRVIDAPELILLSAGPVGKCLIPDLINIMPKTTKIIDSGHFFLHLKDRV